MWIDLTTIAMCCDAPTFSRGLQVFRQQKVLSATLAAVDGWRSTVQAQVDGSDWQPYDVEVELEFAPGTNRLQAWDSTCTCPVGAKCKHAVAALIKAAYTLKPNPIDPITGQRRASKPLSAQERERQNADLLLERQRQAAIQQAERWLLAVPDAPDLGDYAVDPAQRAGSQTESPIYMVYRRSGAAASEPLRLVVGASSVKVKGGWTKPKVVACSYFKETSGYYRQKRPLLTPVDEEVLDLIGALPTVFTYSGYNAESDRLLNGVAAPMVLQRAASTGRLFWRQDDGALGFPLVWGEPMAMQWQWQQIEGPSPEDPYWQLRPVLPQADTQLFGNQPRLLYVQTSAGLCGPLEVSAAALDWLQSPPLPQSVLVKHQVALVQRLGDAAPLPPVMPELQRIGGKPNWHLHLSLVRPDEVADDLPHPGLVTAELEFEYEGHRGWWPLTAPRQVMLEKNGHKLLLTRDYLAEAQAISTLIELGLNEWLDGVFALEPDAPPALWMDWAFAQFQPLRDAGFHLTMDAALQNWVRDGGDLQVGLQARNARGEVLGGEPQGDNPEPAHWFDLSLGLEVGDQRIDVLPWLPQLIQSLRRPAGQDALTLPKYVYLPDPTQPGFVRLSPAPLQPWLEALLELFDDRRAPEDGRLRLSRMEALRTRMAIGEGTVWDAAPQLDTLAQQLKGQNQLPAVPTPKGLHAELRPYQQQGLDWLQFLRIHGLAGILADDMGLGKTLQTLAHIQCEKEAGRLDRPVLVVAPVSLMGNWQREAARFCPELKTLVWHGADRHDLAEHMTQADVVIAPYSLLHRDRARWLQQPWHLVVLDEAQNIKNASTQAAQLVSELDTRSRLCLSGTPIENHLGEIWSLFHFLMPGFLGSQAKFQQRFRNPIEKHGDAQRLAQLRSRLTPFILRRTKQMVAHELPPKVETVTAVELSGKQADLYETIRLSMEQAVRQAISDKGLAKSQIVFLDALLKLRQVCCDPRLVKTAAAAKVKQSAKLEQLMEMLPEMLEEGRRVLLFSQFTSMLSLIEEELRKRKIEWVKLTGQTQKRDEVIERFARGEVPLFLISLKAGGVGLNLPQADTVIHFDPWWNPAAENQATDRAHRIGQTQSVWVVKLVAQGTIEERILALQARKAELARELYSGSVGRKQPTFTEDDVRELLKPIG